MSSFIGPAPSLKTIVEEHAFEKEAARIIQKFPRTEDLIDGLKWRLARSSYGAYELPGTSLKLIKTEHRPAIELPAITVLFQESSQEVNLLAIKVQKRL